VTDVFDPAKRSEIMSGIGNRNTKPEIRLRKVLHHFGFRFRLHRKDLPGSPDIVLPKYSTAVFVHGCFWHGHDCRRGRLPTTNVEFWETKISKNRERDAEATRKLKELGWDVRVVWLCRFTEDADRLVAELNERRRQTS